jgi:hypothetical protein
MITKLTVDITAFGETRSLECSSYGETLDTIRTLGLVVVGRFPTGTKLHRSSLTLWRRNTRPEHPLRGETAAVVNGEEYVADYTLYTHNRNVGRIIGWFKDETPEGVVARWH